MIKFNRILETCLYVDNLDAARIFYGTKLGLDEFSFVPDRFVFYRLETGMLLIFDPAATKKQTNLINGSPVPQHGAIGAGHMAFTIPENQIDPMLNHLKSVDIEVESVVKWPGGGTSIYVRDPSNNSIEFATRSLWF